MVAALVLVAIGSAAGTRPQERAGADPSTVFNLRPAVPIPSCPRSAGRASTVIPRRRAGRGTRRLPLASRVLERDVTEARGQLNLSRWIDYNRLDRADMLDKMCDLASRRKMPPWQYRLMHPGARLSATEISALCAWSQDEAARLTQGEK